MCSSYTREREHAAQAREALRSPLPPGLEHDLGVAGRAERDSARRELAAQLAIVVELAVVTKRQAVLRERLRGRSREVDDGEPAVPERDDDAGAFMLVDAFTVGTAVFEQRGHRE